MSCKVAVIGGGVAGSSVAIYLANAGIDVTLFEKKSSLVDGPPMCHLHAGGNLYREISLNQCIQLLKESIDLVKLYPHSIDFRPTVIATPLNDEDDPKNQIERLKILKEEYRKLVEKDPSNKVLGEVEDYYKIYQKEDLEKLKNHFTKTPKTPDDWIAPFARNADLEKLKYPVILVNEWGLNVFRIGASAELILKKLKAKVKLNSEVLEVQKDFTVTYRENKKLKKEKFDYIINSAGFLSGKIDENLNYNRERYLEFKAAYVTKWEHNENYFPEIIFHGKRGTPKGMAQFTPYYGNYFQLHGMTKEITLFENGLVKGVNFPKIDKFFTDIVEKGWDKNLVEERTKKAIQHMQQFIPNFQAKGAYKPLYGIQQIPGDDPDLRAAEVSFEKDYARCEIVKASSVFAMADEILKDLNCLKDFNTKDFSNFKIDKNEVDKLAMKIAEKRGYPKEMGKVIFTL